MRIAVPTESEPGEARVAATPETVKKFIGLGATVAIESGAGQRSGIRDGDYAASGASIAGNVEEALQDADLILKVRRPSGSELGKVKRGAAVVGIMDPFGQDQA